MDLSSSLPIGGSPFERNESVRSLVKDMLCNVRLPSDTRIYVSVESEYIVWSDIVERVRIR